MVIIGNLLSFPTQSLLCFLFCFSSKPLQISVNMHWYPPCYLCDPYATYYNYKSDQSSYVIIFNNRMNLFYYCENCLAALFNSPAEKLNCYMSEPGLTGIAQFWSSHNTLVQPSRKQRGSSAILEPNIMVQNTQA